MNKMKQLALELLSDCFQDEVETLRIHVMKGELRPDLEHLETQFPELFQTLISEDTPSHEIIAKNRAKRIELLKQIVNGQMVAEGETEQPTGG